MGGVNRQRMFIAGGGASYRRSPSQWPLRLQSYIHKAILVKLTEESDIKFLSKMYSSWSTYIYLFIYLIYTLTPLWLENIQLQFSMNVKTPLYKKTPSNIQVKIISCKTVFSTCPFARFLESPCSQSCHSNCHLHDLVIHIFFFTEQRK